MNVVIKRLIIQMMISWKYMINYESVFGNYYFAINYVNGVSLPLVYSSVRKANIDRNFMVKWLKNSC